MIYIYALLDPRGRRYAYVGQSSKPRVRYRAHINKGQKSRAVGAWLKTLLTVEKSKPILAILESTENRKTASIREAFWIKYLGQHDFELLNKAKPVELRSHAMAKAQISCRIDAEVFKNLKAFARGRHGGNISKALESLLRVGLDMDDAYAIAQRTSERVETIERALKEKGVEL